MNTEDLECLSTHFKFGENWSSYSKLITDERIEIAKNSLLMLLNQEDIAGKAFLDIGCGSGLFSLAALQLGASRVVAIDLDPQSVSTASSILSKYCPGKMYEVHQRSVFELQKDINYIKNFDVVFSWGVLHHTGNMVKAIESAKICLRNRDAKLVLALYSKTRMCGIWTNVKRLYSRSDLVVQRVIRLFFAGLLAMRLIISDLARGRGFLYSLRNYKTNRGMSFLHDAHDWLGGFPYESISRNDFEILSEQLGLKLLFNRGVEGCRIPLGIFGSGCNEYVLQLR